jgi:hypothetical protein
MHILKTPRAILNRFGISVMTGGLKPVMVSQFNAATGWTKTSHKRLTYLTVYKLRKTGVTHVSVRAGLQRADFVVTDLLN